MLTFSDLFWKQKEQKNNLRTTFWMEKQHLGHDIQHEVLGLASRLYSLGVGPKKLVAMHHNTMRGLWVEWAVWLLGGGIVFWESDSDITAVCQLLEDKEVSHIIVENEGWYLDNEEQIEELYDVVHILCLNYSEEMVPLTPASYDEEKLCSIVKNVDIFDDIAWMYIDAQRKESIILHKELLDEAYRIDPNISIHVPINNLHQLRHIVGKYIFTNPMYFYKQLSFSYTNTDVCFADGEFISQFVSLLQKTNATAKIGTYALQWYILLLQQLVHATNPSKRVHLQLLFFKKIIGSIIRDNIGDPIFVFSEKGCDNEVYYIGVRTRSPV